MLHLLRVLYGRRTCAAVQQVLSQVGSQFTRALCNNMCCLSHPAGKGGAIYDKHGGFCLETQGFPNAVNNAAFPSVVVQPGETYRHTMVHRFYTR
eukprot:6606529-Pyramimonas_sp.AAC.1